MPKRERIINFILASILAGGLGVTAGTSYQHHKILEAQNAYIIQLSRDMETLRSEVAATTRDQREFQRWRVIITLASRQGWGAANRYIAQQWQHMPKEWQCE